MPCGVGASRLPYSSIYAIIKQLLLGQPLGDELMSDTALAIAGAIVLSISGAIFWLISIAKLVTEVRGDGLYVRFSPLARQNVLRFTDISRCEVRTYRPIKEYGGWGIRYGGLGRRGRTNKALTISGNRGVQLELSNGNRLLIGSQRPDELLDAIQAETRKRT